jgi:hypothetical protein
MGTINSSDIVCLRNICINTLHKGDSDDNNNIHGCVNFEHLPDNTRILFFGFFSVKFAAC